MLLVLVTLTLSVLLTLIMRSRLSYSSQLVEPRGSMLTMGVQIICGDCSGDDERPVKTYLDRLGNCVQCGGHSFVLASTRTVALKRSMV